MLSVHETRRYKTDPAAYALGTRALGLPAGEILFVSSNCWDAIGATWFGYTTLWVNRFGLPLERLDAAPTRIGSSLRDVLGFFDSRPSPSKDDSMNLDVPAGVQINAPILPGFETILTTDALELVAKLHRAFEPRRQELLAARAERAKRLDAGERPDFLAETKAIREGDWKIAPLPQALSAGASRSPGRSTPRWSSTRSTRARTAYMTDFEDSNSPICGQPDPGPDQHRARRSAARSRSSRAGKSYKLNDKVATLQVRPRGWHLDEKHVLVDGKRVSGGIFDFALFMFHNAKELLARGAGPYFYLPKMESAPRGAALERYLRDDAERARPAAGHDQGDGADRDDPRRVRDGRDPLRAARAQRRPERRPLGLHLLVHQEVQARPATSASPTAPR